MKVLMKEPIKAEAHFYLGTLHEGGLGVDRDYSSALRYYK